jgi:hypothetical protein
VALLRILLQPILWIYVHDPRVTLTEFPLLTTVSFPALRINLLSFPRCTTLFRVQVLAGAELMKAGWEKTFFPRGFWRMPNNTALTRARHAEAKGFPISPYQVALDDMDMSKKLQEETQTQKR